MSADNGIYVYESRQPPHAWFVFDGSESYVGALSSRELEVHIRESSTKAKHFETREQALIAAHDLERSLDVCEYGVTEFRMREGDL